MRPINKVIIQLVSVGSVSELIEKHINEGMPEVGFHYMIEQDGTSTIGRSISTIGNHLIGENADSIGIACIGDGLTRKQESAIDDLLKELSIKSIDTSNVFLVENEELKKYRRYETNK